MSTSDLKTKIRELLGDMPQRAILKKTDSDRAATVAQTSGQPILDVEAHSNPGSTPFVDYLHSDMLHRLQQPRSDEPEELTFICMAHVNEILFKLLCVETLRVQDALSRDALADVFVMLRRIHKVLEFMSQTWGVLSTITPSGYLGFRDHLGISSGFESYMYRRIEFMLGNKQPRMLQVHQHVPQMYRALEAALQAPSLYDDAIALLARRGYAVGEKALARDWSLPYESDPRVQAAWREVYATLPVSHELYQLAESLVDLAERFKLWRFRHFTTVERLIGSKPGTGGTDGIAWLRLVTTQNFFPELWNLRTTL